MSSDSLEVSAEEEQSVSLLSNAMEARAEHLKTRNYRSLYSLTTVLGVGLLVMVFTWLIRFRGGFTWVSDPEHQFNWHPLLLVTALVFIYGQSMLVYRTGRSTSKKRLKIYHAVLHGITFTLTVIGLKAVFDSHNYAKTPIPNLYSLHSWLGLLTVIIFTGQFVLGFATFLFPGLSRSIRQAVLPIHVAIGIATFFLAIVAVMTGLMEKANFALGSSYVTLPSEGILINFIALFTAFFGILVLYLVNDADFKRSNSLEDEVALAPTD